MDALRKYQRFAAEAEGLARAAERIGREIAPLLAERDELERGARAFGHKLPERRPDGGWTDGDPHLYGPHRRRLHEIGDRIAELAAAHAAALEKAGAARAFAGRLASTLRGRRIMP
jgi:hypothetical protein